MVATPEASPLTTPVALTEAIAGALLVHVPPEPEVDNVITELTHTAEAPVMVPASGSGLTVMALVAVAVPQLLVTKYDIVTVPAILPLTIPDALTLATDGMLLIHEPPDAASASVIVE